MSQTEVEAAPVIAVQGLTKRFKGVPVVNEVEFSVQPGDVFGLLGPNGAGKTTIIRMMLGLVKPTAGKATLFGEDVATNKEVILRKTSAIIEAPALYAHLSGWDNIRVMGQMSGVTDRTQLEWALNQMDMLNRAEDKFSTYSLGMKQRLCIAAALLTDPQLIILDEPTNGLDPAGIHDIRNLIKSLSEQGRTVFLSSHLLNEVQQVCNRVAIIQRGKIIAHGLVDDLLAAQSSIRLRIHPKQIAQAQALLGNLAWVRALRQEGEYLIVDGSTNQGAALNQALGQAGIFASEIIPRHLSLEEFFLNVTSGQPQNNNNGKQPVTTKEQALG